MKAREVLLRLFVAPALYGFSVGAVRSWRFALLNLVKFPLLIRISIVVRAGAHFLVARSLCPTLRFADVRGLAPRSYGDTAHVLVGFATVCLFLALTLDQPVSAEELREYPLFVLVNVVLIGGAGAVGLLRQAVALSRAHGVGRGRAVVLCGAWLGVSLFVGGQCAWYLRPFFGIRAIADDVVFCSGARPDFRGNTSFYEAVFRLAVPREGATVR